MNMNIDTEAVAAILQRQLQQYQNTTSCHNSGTMNLNSTRISTARGHALYKYPPRNTMPRSPGTNSKLLQFPGATLLYPLRESDS